MAAGWQTLTAEVQEAILLALEPAERRRVATVCHQWEAAIRNQQQILTADLSKAGEAGLDLASLLRGAAKRRQLTNLNVALLDDTQYATLAVLVREFSGLHALHVVGNDNAVELPAAVLLSLPRLRYLNLIYPESLPARLGSLTALAQQDLEFWDYTHVTLPASLTALRQLQVLRACGRDPDGGGCANLEGVSALRLLGLYAIQYRRLGWVLALTQLTRLGLSGCRRDGEFLEEDAQPFTAQQYDEALQPFMQLRELELSSSQLQELPACVADMADLQRLELLNSTALLSMPSGRYQQSLLALDLPSAGAATNEQFKVPGFAQFLEGLRCVTELRLCSAIVQQPEMQRVLASLPTLRRLELGGGRGAAVTPEALHSLREQLPGLQVVPAVCRVACTLLHDATGQLASSLLPALLGQGLGG